MPANRPDRSRAEKTEELLAIARRLFLERGYAGTTMAAISGEAGIARNVVHWYFASKDELFAQALESFLTETLDALLGRAFAETAPGEERKQLEAGLVELAGLLVRGHALIVAVHERAAHSEVVAAFHARAHALYADHLGRAVARCGVPDEDQDLAADTLLMALESLVMHEASEAEARRTIAFLVSRLTASP